MKILRRLLTVLAALVLFGVVCAAGLIGFVYYKETHLPPVGDFDTIIVLGAQVKADGTPSVALERRLTAALEEYQKQPMLMIVCGAQGSDEPRAEGDVMRDWLIEHGVAASDIEAETGSFNTRQNLGYAQSIMDDRGLTEALIVTSDYHVPRAPGAVQTGWHYRLRQGQPFQAGVFHQKPSARGPELDQIYVGEPL